MAKIVFFEKPGCANNTRQKHLLAAASHAVEPRDLLREPWTAETLRAFFGDLPVAAWFNRAAPQVKSGEILPEAADAAGALSAMLDNPLLIRRPLMEIDGQRFVGFDTEVMRPYLDPGHAAPADLETCRRPDTPCPAPTAEERP